MLLKPFPLLQHAAITAAANDGNTVFIGHHRDIAIHRGKGACLIINATRGDIDLIGIGRNAVDKGLCRKLIGIGIGVFLAAAAAANTDVLGLNDLKQR